MALHTFIHCVHACINCLLCCLQRNYLLEIGSNIDRLVGALRSMMATIEYIFYLLFNPSLPRLPHLYHNSNSSYAVNDNNNLVRQQNAVSFGCFFPRILQRLDIA